MISTPPNSFVEFSADAASSCMDNINLCLPVNSLGDIAFQMLETNTTGSVPASSMSLTLKRTGQTDISLGNISLAWNNIQSPSTSAQSCWLTIFPSTGLSLLQQLELLLPHMKAVFSNYGTWSIDTNNTMLDCTGDISSFNSIIPGLAYTTSCTENCTIIIDSRVPDINILCAYLNQNTFNYGGTFSTFGGCIWAVYNIGSSGAGQLIQVGGNGNYMSSPGSLTDVTYSSGSQNYCALTVDQSQVSITTDIVLEYFNDSNNSTLSSIGTWTKDTYNSNIFNCSGSLATISSDSNAINPFPAIGGLSWSKICPTWSLTVTNTPHITDNTTLQAILTYLQGQCSACNWALNTISSNPVFTSVQNPNLNASIVVNGNTYTINVVNDNTLPCYIHITSYSAAWVTLLGYLDATYTSPAPWTMVQTGVYSSSTLTSGFTVNSGDTVLNDTNGNPLYTFDCNSTLYTLTVSAVTGEPDAYLAAYMNTTFGTGWSVSGSSISFSGSSAEICNFNAKVPGLTYHIHKVVSNCHLSVSGFTPTLSDYAYYLNDAAQLQGGPNGISGNQGGWSIDPEHLSSLVSSHDISGLINHNNFIPGTTCYVACLSDNNNVTEYIFAANVQLSGSLPSGLQPGDCFYFLIGGEYTTNCFSYTPNGCFTSLIRYRCNENAFGFGYYSLNPSSPYNNLDANVYNIVRLPFFLEKPQTKTQRQVYRKSDGNYVKLSAVMQKEYDAVVGWMPDTWHIKLAVALAHDTFQVWDDASGQWDTYIMDEGDYQINWRNEPGINLNVAPATFKLKSMPFDNVNANTQ